MFRIFSPKSEVCEVFRIDAGLHVLIRQPRKTGSFDRSNSTAGFLIYDDVLPETFLINETKETSELLTKIMEVSKEAGLPFEIYAPKIALLPPEGGTNEGLLSYLNSREGVSTDLIDSIELGFFRSRKMYTGINFDHKISIMSSALAHNNTRKEAYDEATKSLDDDLSLVRVRVTGDNSRLQKTLAFLKQIELVREESIAALEFVIDKFVLDKKGAPKRFIRRRDLITEVDRLIKQESQPQP